MVKVTNKLILDYISGNDIDSYSFEELESDCDFMLAVINYTKDKNMYDLCSEELKKDYRFVKKVISLFKKDVDFINEVASVYLNSSNDEVKKLELTIIMSKLLVDTGYNSYELYLAMTYVAQDIEIEALINKFETDYPEYKDKMGKGFYFIIDKFKEHEIIINYYVKTYVDIIISELLDFDFERVVHSRFQNPGDFNNLDFYNILIEILKSHDAALANYVSTHLDSISYYDKKVDFIKHNWNNYIEEEDNYRRYLIYKLLDKYSEDNNFYDYDEILRLIDKELNLGLDLSDELFEKAVSEGYLDNHFDFGTYGYEECDVISLFNDKVISFENMKHYKNIKRIITSVINSKDLVGLERQYFPYNELKVENNNKRKK